VYFEHLYQHQQIAVHGRIPRFCNQSVAPSVLTTISCFVRAVQPANSEYCGGGNIRMIKFNSTLYIFGQLRFLGNFGRYP